MSDGITGELREKMQRYDNFDGTSRVEMGESFFVHLCDAIDAVHALLEQENERLRRELMDRPIAVGADALETVARLERENAALKKSTAHAYTAGCEYAELDHDGLMELPKDKDGKYIKEHDMVDWRDHSGEWHEGATVVGVCSDGCYVMDFGVFHVHKSDIRHGKPDSWERIIYDALQAGRTDKAVDLKPIIKRCKALAGEME